MDKAYQQWKIDVNSIGTYFLLKKDTDGLKVTKLSEYHDFFNNVAPDNVSLFIIIIIIIYAFFSNLNAKSVYLPLPIHPTLLPTLDGL